jgi:hypothetical protein
MIQRLRDLPRRLLTPGWLPAKMRYLRKQWFHDAGAGASRRA